MKKSILLISKNNKFLKKVNQNKKIKINAKLFSLKLFPYNKILRNLLIYLQKKLSPLLFNDVYTFSINQIKNFLKKDISTNNLSNNPNNNISFNKNKTDILNGSRIMTDFSYNNYENDKTKPLFKNRTKVNLKQYIKPFINVSYSHKFRNEFLNNKAISSFSHNLNNKNMSGNISLLNDKDISFIFAENNYTVENLGKTNKNKKFNTKNNSIKKSKNNNKNVFENLFLSSNNNFNTINTTIHNNDKNKISMMDKKKGLASKFSLKKNFGYHPILPTSPNPQYHSSKKKEVKKINKIKSHINSKFKNLNNAVVINNTFFNKYKNNYNFGLVPNAQKKIKILKLNLKNKDTKEGNKNNKPSQNSDEMIDKIKKSLDDNLKVMLNFSYENFLSKESERESKEYSFGD